jgi:hypothetical protein
LSGAGYSTTSTVTPYFFSIAATVDFIASMPAWPWFAIRIVSACASVETALSRMAHRPPMTVFFNGSPPFWFGSALQHREKNVHAFLNEAR